MAGFKDGNALFRDCQGGDDPGQRQPGDPGGLSEWGMCLGYILGVQDTLENDLYVCMPTGVTQGANKGRCDALPPRSPRDTTFVCSLSGC